MFHQISTVDIVFIIALFISGNAVAEGTLGFEGLYACGFFLGECIVVKRNVCLVNNLLLNYFRCK